MSKLLNINMLYEGSGINVSVFVFPEDFAFRSVVPISRKNIIRWSVLFLLDFTLFGYNNFKRDYLSDSQCPLMNLRLLINHDFLFDYVLNLGLLI